IVLANSSLAFIAHKAWAEISEIADVTQPDSQPVVKTFSERLLTKQPQPLAQLDESTSQHSKYCGQFDCSHDWLISSSLCNVPVFMQYLHENR
ncbi:unnamed protein product, partial [Clonostachys solani]